MNVSAPFEPAICVRDLERCLAFYRDVLGLRVVSIDDIDEARARSAGLAQSGYRIARLDSEGGDRLKLVAPAAVPLQQTVSEYAMQSAGFAYLTFVVPDVRAILSALRAANAVLHTGIEPVAFRPGVVELCMARDPEGNLLEFVERRDLATYRPTSQAARR